MREKRKGCVMGLARLLFSFHGRITRGQYWLGGFIVALIGLVALGATSALVEASWRAERGIAAALASFAVVYLFSLIFMLWSGLALQVKRLHDRGRSGWFAALPFAVSGLMILSIANAAMSVATPKAALLASIDAATPYGIVLFLINIWFFIDLCCLGSVERPTRYDGPSAPQVQTAPPANAPTPIAPVPTASGSLAIVAQPAPRTSLSAAEQAIARAVAERKAQQSQPKPKSSSPAAGFGQRTAPALAARALSFGKRGL